MYFVVQDTNMKKNFVHDFIIEIIEERIINFNISESLQVFLLLQNCVMILEKFLIYFFNNLHSIFKLNKNHHINYLFP